MAIELLFEKDKLIIEYESDNDWIDEKDDFQLFGRAITLKKEDIENKDGETYRIVLGVADGNYYKIEKRKLGTTFNLYIDKDLDIDWTWFYCVITPRTYDSKDDEGNVYQRKSTMCMVFFCIASKSFTRRTNYILYIETDDYVDTDNEAVHITETTYRALIDKFPTIANARLYKLSEFTKILREEIDVEDYDEKFAKYKARTYKTSVAYKDSIPASIIQSNIAKYEYVRDQIKAMLEASESGASIHEDKFTKAIVDIFLLLNPKYVKVVEKINI